MRGNVDNLRALSTDEARERGAKGGRASGVSRRKKIEMRAIMRALLNGDKDGKTGAEALALALYERALSGDVRAAEGVLAVAGESPRQTLPPFALPDVTAAADLPKLTAGILKAVADGKLTPEEGLKLAGVVAAHTKALETADLEQRIAAMEARLEQSAK